jgi:uncharacterized membrane protein
MTDTLSISPAPIPAPEGARSHEDRVLPAVIYGLYLFGAFSALITVIIGLVIAYVNRGAAGARMESHYSFLIRTFWMTLGWIAIGGLLTLVGGVLSLVLIGLPILGLGLLILSLFGLWFIARCCLGAYYLARDEAYPRPDSWLF